MRLIFLSFSLAGSALLLGGCASGNLPGGSLLPSTSQSVHTGQPAATVRSLDSLGGGVMSVRHAKQLDSLGGGVMSVRHPKQLDSLGGGVMSVRHAKQLDSLGGGVMSVRHAKQLDSLGGGIM